MLDYFTALTKLFSENVVITAGEFCLKLNKVKLQAKK